MTDGPGQPDVGPSVVLSLSITNPGEPLVSQMFTLWEQARQEGSQATLSSISLDE